MTRFARSDGSKSSNKKTYEEATPWEEICAQMTKSKEIVEKEKPSQENAVEKTVEKKKSKKRKIENNEVNKSSSNEEVTSSDYVNFPEGNGLEEEMQSVPEDKGTKKKKKSKHVNTEEEITIEKKKSKKRKIENNEVNKSSSNEEVTSSDYVNFPEGNGLEEEMHSVPEDKRTKKKKKSKHLNTEEEITIGKKKSKKRKIENEELNKSIINEELTSSNHGKIFEEEGFEGEKHPVVNKKGIKKKKKSKTPSSEDQKNNFIIEDGKKIKVLKNGKKKPWFELPYEENDYMTRYKNFYVKCDMVKALDQLKESLEAEGLDKKQISNKMLHKERKAHNQLRLELLRKQMAEAKKTTKLKVSTKSLDRKIRRKKKVFESEDNSFVGEKYTHGEERNEEPKSPSKNPFFKFEENELMTQYEGTWVLKESVEYLNYISDLKINRIIKNRDDGSTDPNLTEDEQLAFRRLMKKEKRREERKLKLKLGEEAQYSMSMNQGPGSKVGKRKPGKYLGIDYKEGLDMVKFDGYFIGTEGAERLHKLKEKLVQNGCTEEEIFYAMRNERRKEEKLLKKDKRLFCYQCRRVGHMLSSCPQGADNYGDKGIEICFKCGSTEHMARHCQLNKADSTYTHATCFTCGETGHIARECPDNPKGLYPEGGCCRECGSVEHLRKDCPNYIDETKDTSMKLAIFDPTQSIDTMEKFSDDEQKEEIVVKKSKKTKIIKF